jgi:hypothetical protein
MQAGKATRLPALVPDAFRSDPRAKPPRIRARGTRSHPHAILPSPCVPPPSPSQSTRPPVRSSPVTGSDYYSHSRRAIHSYSGSASQAGGCQARTRMSSIATSGCAVGSTWLGDVGSSVIVDGPAVRWTE